MLGAVAFACLSLGTVVACNGVDNPFNPPAKPRIIDVKSSEEGRFVGIRQSISEENGAKFILYSYSEPVVTIEQDAGRPLVNFKRFSANITLSDGTTLPLKEFPLSKGMVEGQKLEIQFPIMGVDRDLQNVVYAGNNAPRVSDGVADVKLFGTDLNGHNIEVAFSVPLRFESIVFPDSPVPPTLAPSASPSSNSTSNGGAN